MTKITLDKIVNYIFPTRDNLSEIGAFYYPSYRGLSSNIRRNLSAEAVDAMQYTLQNKYKLKSAFKKAYIRMLLYLGEKIK